MAFLLLYAAAQKLSSPSSFRQTLTALKVPSPKIISVFVPLVEIGTAFSLIAIPHELTTSALVAGLGLSFAAAALTALVRKQNIRCACYGQAGEANLGARQLMALPAWLAVAVMSYYLPDGGVAGVEYIPVSGLALAVFVVLRSFLRPALRNRSYLRVLETQ
ncbi:hypothetical protein EJK15_08955 [Nonomuraea basaltis]|nr:hypothetical protein EJK15_08955 [Nonomuraea basaltis]